MEEAGVICVEDTGEQCNGSSLYMSHSCHKVKANHLSIVLIFDRDVIKLNDTLYVVINYIGEVSYDESYLQNRPNTVFLTPSLLM